MLTKWTVCSAIVSFEVFVLLAVVDPSSCLNWPCHLAMFASFEPLARMIVKRPSLTSLPVFGI